MVLAVKRIKSDYWPKIGYKVLSFFIHFSSILSLHTFHYFDIFNVFTIFDGMQ